MLQLDAFGSDGACPVVFEDSFQRLVVSYYDGDFWGSHQEGPENVQAIVNS